MSLILKMQINDQSENKYIFSTENGEIELIPLSVIENGTYTPEQGQAFSTVTVAVPQTVLEQLNITANGTYEASSGHAYDVVTVNVQPILDILVDTVNENGTYIYEPEEGYDGLEEVRVTVSVPEPVFEHLTRTITSNGTYNYTPSSGKDGFDEAQITVNVPQPQPNLEQKSAYYDTNGNYTIQPSQGYDGISEVSVEVDVSGGSTPTVGTLDLTGTNKITQNGTYNVSPSTFSLDYFDGASIDVDVSGGGGLSNVLKLTYTPSANSNAEDVIATGYTGTGYIIGILAVNNSSSADVTKYGCIFSAGVMKRLASATPDYTGSSTQVVNSGVSYKTYANGTSIAAGGSNSLNVYNSAAASTGSGTGATAIAINSATSISLRHIPSSNQSASTVGFMYGQSYDIYVIYSA